MKFIKYLPTGTFIYFGMRVVMLSTKTEPFSLASAVCYSLGLLGFAVAIQLYKDVE